MDMLMLERLEEDVRLCEDMLEAAVRHQRQTAQTQQRLIRVDKYRDHSAEMRDAIRWRVDASADLNMACGRLAEARKARQEEGAKC